MPRWGWIIAGTLAIAAGVIALFPLRLAIADSGIVATHISGTIWRGQIAGAQWRGIMLGDLEGLDANPKSADPDGQAGFAAFGHVVSGMEVVRAIWDAPRSPTKGEGVMRGQMLDPPVKIITARRLP